MFLNPDIFLFYLLSFCFFFPLEYDVFSVISAICLELQKVGNILCSGWFKGLKESFSWASSENECLFVVATMEFGNK
jgi:hypothetical protein